jgi:hypothetical protein
MKQGAALGKNNDTEVNIYNDENIDFNLQKAFELVARMKSNLVNNQN